ncbi:MAG: nucleotidyltransferase family protein, partial [Chlamydiia bacterium]
MQTWSDKERDDALRQIWSLLNIHAQGLKETFGVERIGLFGSWVQGTAQPWSAVDILVDWPDADIYSYVEIKDFLDMIFGR